MHLASKTPLQIELSSHYREDRKLRLAAAGNDSSKTLPSEDNSRNGAIIRLQNNSSMKTNNSKVAVKGRKQVRGSYCE